MPDDAYPDVDERDYDEELEQPVVPRLGSRRWWWIAAAILVPAVALLAWIGVQNATDVITHRVINYRVADDRSVMVDFEVTRPRGWTVSCEVEALDVRFAPVGTAHVRVTADDRQDTTRTRTTLRTTSRAVTGTVKLCTRV